jgi:hypothetical protein
MAIMVRFVLVFGWLLRVEMELSAKVVLDRLAAVVVDCLFNPGTISNSNRNCLMRTL